MALIGPDNPIAWAHFRLRGGWARSLLVAGGFLLLAGAAAVISSRVDPRFAQQTMFGWSLAMLGLNAAIWVLYVPGRISGIVRQDISTRMIDSHRLMPLPPAHAITGYIAGAALQPLVLSAAIFFLGSICASAAQVQFSRWAMAHLVLGGFAIFAWVMATFAAFRTRGAGALIFLPLAIPWFSAGGALTLLPGLAVLLSPIIGHSVFDLRATITELPAAYAMAAVAQIMLGSIAFAGAMRKYRDADALTLPPVLGLCVLIASMAVSFAGLREWESFQPRGWSQATTGPETQLVASIAVLMLLALAPLSAAARVRLRRRRQILLNDPAPIARPLSLALILAVITVTPLLLSFARPNASMPTIDALGRTALIVAAYSIGAYCLMYWVYRAVQSAAMIVAVWLVLTWVAPLGVEFVRYQLAESADRDPISGVAAYSPVGALILIWSHQPISTNIGIAAQLALMMVPVMLCGLCLWQRRRSRDGYKAADSR